MLKYSLESNPRKSAKAYGRALRISNKSSVRVCREINGMNLAKGKRLLGDLIKKRRSMEGKYYTNASREILNIINSAEANAEFKGLDSERLVIHASSHQGFTFMRPRKLKMRGTRRKITNIQVVLEQK